MLLNSGHFYPSRSGKVDKSSVVLCIKSKSRTGFEGVVKTVFGSSDMKMVTPLDIYDWRASIGRTSYHPPVRPFLPKRTKWVDAADQVTQHCTGLSLSVSWLPAQWTGAKKERIPEQVTLGIERTD